MAEGDKGPLIIGGYAAVFDRETTIAGLFRERIAPGAFDDTIRRRDDVRCLVNHDQNHILSRRANDTLTLSTDRVGLRFEAQLDRDVRDSADAGARIGRGDWSECSFAFHVDDEDWTIDNGTLPLRTLLRVRLVDVSVVTYPAYLGTSVKARSAARAVSSGLSLSVARARCRVLERGI